MPVEFLTDDEAAAYGRYAGPPSQADLDRVFFLDDDDLKLVCKHRGDHMRAGFALQLVTVRWLGKFLEDPLEVPDGVLEFVAGKQLGMAELAEVKRYTERSTRGSITSGRSRRSAATGSSTTPRMSSRSGQRPGRGRRETARRRSSPTGWRGCESGTSCCPA